MVAGLLAGAELGRAEILLAIALQVDEVVAGCSVVDELFRFG